MQRLLVAAAAALVASVACAQEQQSQESKSWWSKSLDAVNSTSPFVVGSKKTQDVGWWSGAWDGTKRIWREGTHDMYISGWTWHLPYEYSYQDRHDGSLNQNTWGLGFGKTLTDERDNQRSLYAMAIQDSHFKPQYQAGYAWMARWRMFDDVRFGAGYTLLILSREDYNDYMPFPAAAPLVSVGNNTASVFATYIPGSAAIVYIFGRISFDAK